LRNPLTSIAGAAYYLNAKLVPSLGLERRRCLLSSRRALDIQTR